MKWRRGRLQKARLIAMPANAADIAIIDKAPMKSFKQLMKEKTGEVNVCNAPMEDKMKRIRDLGVKN